MENSHTNEKDKEKRSFIVNFRANRNRIKINELGSLYLDKDMQKDYRPLIYIGRQMEHRCHRYENITGRTFDSGHGMFDGSWMYEYPNKGTKSNINTLNFADNLVKAIEASGLDEVDIITESYGGLIAACASKSKRIHKVVAICPPILGTPLASNDVLLDNLNKLEKKQRRYAQAVALVVNDYFGFEQDNYLGINNSDILKNIDFSKLTVVGNNMDRANDKHKLACYLYDIIYAITGEKSDGVVIFDENRLKSLGINYAIEKHLKNHFDAGSERNIKRVASTHFEGFDFEYDDEIPELTDSRLNVSLGVDGTDKQTEGFLDDDISISLEDLFEDEENKASDEQLKIMTLEELDEQVEENIFGKCYSNEYQKLILDYFKG